MANIILPQAKVLDTISDNATMLVEQNGEIRRYNVTSLTEDFVSQVDNKPKAGFIYPLATPVVPEGFLLCDGAEYSRIEYPELFAAIGTIYGAGNGSTTFNVPNLATRVPVGTGSGYTLGATGGEEKHTLTAEEMPDHSHAVTIYVGSGSYGGGIVNYSSSAGGNQYGTNSSTGGSKSHNNMQPYTVVNYIIATGKNTGVSVADIITGAQALPLGVEYGGTGATNAEMARRNLGIKRVARNLLDNSDFTNPVNQRGQSACSTNGYWIDRWRHAATGYLDIKSGCIGINAIGNTVGGIIQYLENPALYDGKKLTLAVCAKSDGGLIRLSFPYVEEMTNIQLNNEWNIYVLSITFKVNEMNGIGIYAESGSAIDIKWAALYEGEYTVETLPEYQPKGYGPELAECKRYYQYFNFADFIRMYSGTTQVHAAFREYTALNMRKFPTITISKVYNYNLVTVEFQAIGSLNGLISLIVNDNTNTVVYRIESLELSADL